MLLGRPGAGSRMLLGPNRNGMGLSLVLGGDAMEMGCYWDVIGMLWGCYRDVIGMLLGCYRSVIGMLLGFYCDVVGMIFGWYWACMWI